MPVIGIRGSLRRAAEVVYWPEVQFLSDGYDDLVNSSKGMADEFQKLESILNTIQSRVTNNAKAIDDHDDLQLLVQHKDHWGSTSD